MARARSVRVLGSYSVSEDGEELTVYRATAVVEASVPEHVVDMVVEAAFERLLESPRFRALARRLVERLVTPERLRRWLAAGDAVRRARVKVVDGRSFEVELEVYADEFGGEVGPADVAGLLEEDLEELMRELAGRAAEELARILRRCLEAEAGA